MNSSLDVNIDFMEGRTFIVGREGHIYINDRSVSRKHAEIKLINGEIRIRDLDSTNGTYVVKDNSVVQFKEAIVKPEHTVVIGKKAFTVRDLLATIEVFAAYSDKTGAIQP
ncbi:MAG: FHA domain-containing protein [Gammaproteobacteria bacterium]|nr:FHA domain-containing protein [Gammaproteobacteria bacterium]